MGSFSKNLYYSLLALLHKGLCERELFNLVSVVIIPTRNYEAQLEVLNGSLKLLCTGTGTAMWQL
jgi:hypothetical protein